MILTFLVQFLIGLHFLSFNKASKLWNKLSTGAKEFDCFNQFKYDLRLKLLGRYTFETL